MDFFYSLDTLQETVKKLIEEEVPKEAASMMAAVAICERLEAILKEVSK